MSTPLIPISFFVLLVVFLFEARAARRRRAGLPIFDFSGVRSRLASMPYPKWPNLGEALMLVALSAAIWAALVWSVPR